MTTLPEIAGNYYFKSPYHKNKKKLPFTIERDGYVETVEYKGWQAYLIKTFYKLETLRQMIDKKIIIPGEVAFPRSIKEQTD